MMGITADEFTVQYPSFKLVYDRIKLFLSSYELYMS